MTLRINFLQIIYKMQKKTLFGQTYLDFNAKSGLTSIN